MPKMGTSQINNTNTVPYIGPAKLINIVDSTMSNIKAKSIPIISCSQTQHHYMAVHESVTQE